MHAIYGTARRVMGFGKLMYVSFPDGAEGEPVIIACDLSWWASLPSIWASQFSGRRDWIIM